MSLEPKTHYYFVVYEDHWPFYKGEILILSSQWDREVFGDGRKPSKWDVEGEEFLTAVEAVAELRSRGITPQPAALEDIDLSDLEAVRGLIQALDRADDI